MGGFIGIVGKKAHMGLSGKQSVAFQVEVSAEQVLPRWNAIASSLQPPCWLCPWAKHLFPGVVIGLMVRRSIDPGGGFAVRRSQWKHLKCEYPYCSVCFMELGIVWAPGIALWVKPLCHIQRWLVRQVYNKQSEEESSVDSSAGRSSL